MRIFSAYYFVYFLAIAATQSFLSLYLSQKGLDSTTIGLLLAVGAVAGMVAQPIFGYLNDRARDARRLLFWGAFIAPMTFAGYAVFHRVFALLIVSVVVATLQSTAPIADAMAVDEGEKSGFAYGQIRLWGALSFAISTSVAGYVYNVSSIQLCFPIYGGLTILLCATIWRMPKGIGVSRPSENILRGIWNVARNRRLISFIVLCFILSTAIQINAVYLPLYYQDLGYPMRFVGLNFSVAALVEVPLFYLSGRLMKRFGTMRVLILGTLLYTLKYAIMAFAPGAALVIAIQALDGIGWALYWSAGVQIVSSLAPVDRSATAQTLYGAIASSLSGIVGSSLGGVLLYSVGPLALFGYTAGIGSIALVGFIVFAYRIQHLYPRARKQSLDGAESKPF